MAKRHRPLSPNDPLRHDDHSRPTSRRDFLRYGMMAGTGALMGGGLFSLFANPRSAYAALASDLEPLKAGCPNINALGGGKIPFIAFDLAGGASITGSNVIGGKRGGQLDFISTSGYGLQGLPGDMLPGMNDPNGLPYTNTELGLAFHSDSGFLRGMLEKISITRRANINGALIPARSDNDTGNNPHNPMYAINRAGANGELLTLIGSRNSESGGNSVAPPDLVNPEVRPTKIDRPTDVTGLVDTGKLVGLLSEDDATAVMESIYRLSEMKLGRVDTKLSTDAVVKDLVRCGYLKSADIVDRYGNPNTLDVELDSNIVGADGIFSDEEWAGPDRSEFQKTASVMKLVMNGYAGAGTITMGGYDYHTGDRAVGELRDLRAGRCMGACLEYAARLEVPLMLHVFSDGSVFSNGNLDNSENGRGKGVWTGDNSSTAASFFLVYNPNGRPQSLGTDPNLGHQLGFFRPDGSVETSSSPAANNVNLLVNTIALNYMALHNETDLFDTANYFPNHGLGSATQRDNLTAFQPLT